MLPSSELKKVNAKDYLSIVTSRLWIVAVAVAIALACAIFYSLSLPKIYGTRATVLVEEHPVLKTIRVEGITTMQGGRAKDMSILIEHIRSRAFAEEVAKNIGSDAGRVQSMVHVWAHTDHRTKRLQNIISISANGANPVEITNVVNAYVDELIKGDVKTRKDVSEYGASWLDENRTDVLKKLQVAEGALAEFTEANEGVELRAATLERLRGRKEALEGEVQELLLKYKEKHPEIKLLRRRIEIVEEQTREAKGGPEGEEKIEKNIFEYNLLRGHVESLLSLYARISQASEEADISKGLVLPGIQVIDKAEIPGRPLPPPKGVVGRMLMMGFLAGVGLCFLMEYLDTSLKSAEEVEFFAGMLLLGNVPQSSKDVQKKDDIYRIVDVKPTSPAAESFRNTKVSLLFASTEDNPLSTIMIGSSVSDEGKTFVASNLAITFAHSSESTVLVDADMRKGKLAEIYDIKSGRSRGLSGFLSGESTLEKAIVSTDISNLSVLPCGSHVFNPTDLLLPDKLDDLIKTLKSKYQRVVIDAPAILKFADVMLWEGRCDGMLYIVSAGTTEVKKITEAKKKIEGRVEILGAVLDNAVGDKNFHYYYKRLRSTIDEKIGA